EIGRVPRAQAKHSPFQIALGFAAIYLIWGSTYLGIRYAVETIPPLLMMGLRHTTAGILVYGWARSRGAAAPQSRDRFFFSRDTACWPGRNRKFLRAWRLSCAPPFPFGRGWWRA